jgi:DNA-binding NarL/FixJ family response regulator
MTTNEWVAVIGCAIALLTAIYSVIRFVTKSIMRELLPNSGKSMRDEIRSLSNRVDEIFSLLAKGND